MNKYLDMAFKKLASKKYDSYYLPLSNENLYEFTKLKQNFLIDLSGFSGDTGSIFLYKNKAYLFVDGRFTIQAKKEVKDKRIKVVEINKSNEIIDFIISKLNKNKSIVINPKLFSIYYINNLINKIKKFNISLVFDNNFLIKEFNSIKSNCFSLSSAPLFSLDNKYVGEKPKSKIKYIINKISDDNNISKTVIYITSNLEEIAYITNLRFKFCDLPNESILFDSFMIITNNKSYLYIKDYLTDKDIKYLKNNNIFVLNIKKFYTDLKKYINNNYIYLDDRINNYYIYKLLRKVNFIQSPLLIKKSIKNKIEIKNLRKCNVIDGIAMTIALYNIKEKKIFKNEYEIKEFIDDTRRKVGKKFFLSPSFDTIVAFKENSAICHYVPNKGNSKKIVKNGILLIDSGGNYLYGTTDITRTISLYNSEVPRIIKKHYTLVLKSLIDLSMLIYKFGLTGYEIDIIARKNLYNNFLDFNHGTGHGIGYISNVHDGPNRIGPFINNNFNNNVLFENQLSSNEPGLYFEGKYGIRLENDILTKHIKSNEYGDFMGFETLTLCPFDKDLIDKNYLNKEEIMYLNKYHKLVYKKINKYLNFDQKKWLKKITLEVQYDH